MLAIGIGFIDEGEFARSEGVCSAGFFFVDCDTPSTIFINIECWEDIFTARFGGRFVIYFQVILPYDFGFGDVFWFRDGGVFLCATRKYQGKHSYEEPSVWPNGHYVRVYRMKNLYYGNVETFADTIVAPITGAGRAAVAILRLSGPKAWEITGKVFSPWPGVVEPRHILYGRFINGDDGLVFPFEEGRSFTGEQVAELSLHGSVASVESLLGECLKAGARLAEPGEFSLRAFLNGEIDLTEAEGIRETVDAATSAQLRQANAFRSGKVRAEIEMIRDLVISVLTAVEASTDFSEEIGDLDRDLARSKLANAREQIDRLLMTADIGCRVRTGATVAIVGAPNAGKSSLLNALLREDRAIVTAVPGTTRDTIEAMVELGGLPVRFVDTAGIRETLDEVERIGVDRSRRAIESADLVLHLIDLCRPEEMEISHAHVLRVGNKVDLAPSGGFDGVRISALTGEGLDVLIAEIRGFLGDVQTAEIPILDRHAVLLEEARGAVMETMQTLDAPVPDDLAAVSLRSAARLLGEITGETTPPDVIDRIFHDFCIGK